MVQGKGASAIIIYIIGMRFRAKVLAPSLSQQGVSTLSVATVPSDPNPNPNLGSGVGSFLPDPELLAHQLDLTRERRRSDATQP